MSTRQASGRRRGLCLALSLAIVLMGCGSSGAGDAHARASVEPPTPYVDGISDQSLPTWDGGFFASRFAAFFRGAWVGSPPSHIVLARYVVQWNVMTGSSAHYRLEFERWLTDVGSLDLIPVVALSSYDGLRPSSAAEYQRNLQLLLTRAREMGYPVRYLEAWNEPNNQGGYRRTGEAEIPARFTDAASATCGEGYGCTVIAGDLEDNDEVGAYEREYEKWLSPVPEIWGIHPYQAVKSHDDANALSFKAALPPGAQLWITEVGAYRCEPYDREPRGEVKQAEDASWLVNTLMPAIEALHVFYYSFLLGDRRRPSCEDGASDTALYAPGAEPTAPDAPRAAASIIYEGRGFPWEYTAAISRVDPPGAPLSGALEIGGGPTPW